MHQLFFLLSGEHKTLPIAELEAVLETEEINFKESQRLPQVLRLNTTADAAKAVEKRTALTRNCCRELFCCKASPKEITQAMQAASIDSLLQPGESFAVRVRRVGTAAPNLSRMYLERNLGQLIINKIQRAKVNLKAPRKTFFGIITGNSFLFGLKLAETQPTHFMQRRPRKRPFFHPSAMPAKLARCMVNLAGAKKDSSVLDPFCGTGSILIEAGLLGCRVLGFDANKRMVKGTLRNLDFFNVESECLGVADAKRLPLTKIDRIVTDPPYGRCASTMGYTTKRIFQDFLAAVSDQLRKRQRICLASPKTVKIADIAETSGFKQVQSHFAYVHRSLTREIAVLEKA